MTLDELETLEKAATPGPWYGNNFCNWFAALGIEMTDTDAALIAAARNMLPKLIAVAKGATELLDNIDLEDYPKRSAALLSALAALEEP